MRSRLPFGSRRCCRSSVSQLLSLARQTLHRAIRLSLDLILGTRVSYHRDRQPSGIGAIPPAFRNTCGGITETVAAAAVAAWRSTCTSFIIARFRHLTIIMINLPPCF